MHHATTSQQRSAPPSTSSTSPTARPTTATVRWWTDRTVTTETATTLPDVLAVIERAAVDRFGPPAGDVLGYACLAEGGRRWTVNRVRHHRNGVPVFYPVASVTVHGGRR